jgi:hypothetical protein
MVSLVAAAAAAAAGATTTAGCSTVDVGDPPADVNACRSSQQLFVDQVWPNYLAPSHSGKTCGDASCHASSNRPLHIVAPTSTPTPTVPFVAGSDWDLLYQSAANQMNCSDVAGSELYTKPSGLSQHDGGKLFEPGGPELTLLTQWVAGP